jgi:hypothetical protein
MKFKFLFLPLCLFFQFCNDPGPAQATQTAPDTASAAKNYFPVIDFIRSEIKYVDSLPVGIMKYVSLNGQKDSGYIKLDEFHQLAEEFLPRELNDSNFIDNYEESSFYDRSTKTSTFLYTAKDKSMPVQRVDVLSKPDQVYDKVTSIYIQKNISSDDSFVIKKLYWKPGRHFQISSEKRLEGSAPLETQIKVVWDNREENQ